MHMLMLQPCAAHPAVLTPQCGSRQVSARTGIAPAAWAPPRHSSLHHTPHLAPQGPSLRWRPHHRALSHRPWLRLELRSTGSALIMAPQPPETCRAAACGATACMARWGQPLPPYHPQCAREGTPAPGRVPAPRDAHGACHFTSAAAAHPLLLPGPDHTLTLLHTAWRPSIPEDILARLE